VSVELTDKIVTFIKSADCLLIFLGAYAKYSIENDYSINAYQCNLASIESVIQFYEKNV